MPAPAPLLAHLSTRWTWLNLAHTADRAAARSAVGWLVERYRPAAVRYLRGAVGDPDAAEDLFQEFTVRLTRGDFRTADPARGRFRDFLRTTLARLAADHYRRAARRPAQGPVPDPPDPRPRPDDERALSDGCREVVLAEAWADLGRLERDTARPLCTLLRLRADHPAARSEELAGRMSAALGRAVTPGWVRKRLMEARARFTEFVVDAVAATLDDPTPADVAEELAELGLLTSCREAANRWLPR